MKECPYCQEEIILVTEDYIDYCNHCELVVENQQ